MQCPYCQSEMLKGSIGAYNLLSFTPDGDKAPKITKWGKSKHGIKLADYDGFHLASIAACYCKSCNKIVINVPEH